MITVISTEEPRFIFTRFVHDWFRLLTYGEFSDAASLLDEPNSYGERWDALKIQQALQDHARFNSVRVSDPDTLASGGRISMGEFTDGHGYWFAHDIPLDGQWSDLTAQFEFLRCPNGYIVVLNDIHVL